MSLVSRRFVLTGAALTTASLLVPITLRAGRAADSYEITDWIAIPPSGEVTLALSQPEVGQGSYTALPQILADELDADWERVTIRFVTGKPAYKIAFRQEPPAQKEGASMSTTALYTRLRTAGAAARLRRRRRESQRHISRRKLRPQDRPGLCAAGRAGIKSSGPPGQAHPLARGGHAARRLSAQRGRPLSRGAG